MRFGPIFLLLAALAVAAPASALTLGGTDYDIHLSGQSLGLDSAAAAPAPAPVAAQAVVRTGDVQLSGRGPACTIQSSDLASSSCDAGTHSASAGAPTVSTGVHLGVFAPAAVQSAGSPSFRERLAYAGEYEVTVPQLAAAAAAASAFSAVGYALWRAAKSGALLALVPLATHLKPSELLDDPHRKAIHDLIRTEPGISTKDLADRLGLAWGTVTHHLVKLEKARFVVSHKFGKYRRYFVNGSGIEQKEAVAVMKVARTSDVVDYVRANPGASQKDVSEGMGVSSSTVLWHVKRLMKVGLIEKVRDGKSVRYFVREPAPASPPAIQPLNA